MQAVRMNERDERHPVIELIRVVDGKVMGRLQREFGCSFNPKRCWRQVDGSVFGIGGVKDAK